MNYKLLRAHNALSRLAQHAVFARMQDCHRAPSAAGGRPGLPYGAVTIGGSEEPGRGASGTSTPISAITTFECALGAMRRQLDARTSELQAALTRLLVGRRNELDRLS